MTPVKQNITHDAVSVGNCFQACVASILDLPLDEVPHFCNDYGQVDRFPLNYMKWLAARGLVYLEFSTDSTGAMEFWGHHLICGPSPRGDFLHSVVGFNGEPVFDPHPSGDMLRPG